MPESVLLGAETVHRHYDADDTLTGYTVIESPWLDADREALEALAEYESMVCPGCGLHESHTRNPDNRFTFEDDHCPTCRGAARYGRMQVSRDESEEQRLRDTPMAARDADGRHTFIKLLPPSGAAPDPEGVG